MFFEKFDENLTLPVGGGGGDDSIFESADFLPPYLKLNKLPKLRSGFHETL